MIQQASYPLQPMVDSSWFIVKDLWQITVKGFNLYRFSIEIDTVRLFIANFMASVIKAEFMKLLVILP